MKTVKAKPNQTIYDVALEQYGNDEAAGEIMTNNPGLRNDPAALAALGINAIEDDGFYMDAALLVGTAIRIDTDSPLVRPLVLKELAGEEITTFDLE
jgi:FMN phosphatase YigB (HAD superfamily)